MANNCYNYLEITGKKSDILKLEEFIKSKDEKGNDEWDLTKIIPVEIDEEGCYKVKDIYAVWGTKWMDGVWFENKGKSATLILETAWSPCCPVTLEMSKKFNLKINHSYEESGCDFEGDYNVNCGDEILDETRNYRPNCVDCEEKFDRVDMIYDEDDGDYRCRECGDPLVSVVAEKLRKIEDTRKRRLKIKMICPKCKKKITHLIQQVEGFREYELYNNKGEMDWRDGEIDFEDNATSPIIFCPECREEFSYTDAEALIENEDKLADIVAEKINKDKTKGKET